MDPGRVITGIPPRIRPTMPSKADTGSHLALGAAVGMSVLVATIACLLIATVLALREVRGLKTRIGRCDRLVPTRPARHGHGANAGVAK